MSLPPHQATFTHSKRNKQKNKREFREMLVVESGYRSSDSRQDQAVLHPRRRLSARSARTDVGISVAVLPCSGAQCISWAPARTSRDMVTPSRGALLLRACRRKEPFLPVAGYNRPLPRMFPLKKGRGRGGSNPPLFHLFSLAFSHGDARASQDDEKKKKKRQKQKTTKRCDVALGIRRDECEKANLGFGERPFCLGGGLN